LDRIEYRLAKVNRSTFSWRHAADDLRPIRHHLLGVERALVSGEPLDNDACLLVEQNAHAALDPSHAATTRSAASASESAVRMGSPLSCRILRPSSTFVPASLTTRGTGTCTSRTAWTTPCATQSHRLIPANTFT